MDLASLKPRVRTGLSFAGNYALTETLAEGQSSVVERLLRVVLASTCGVASPVMLSANIVKPLRPGEYDIQASMRHADGRQQRWVAEITQANDLVSRAHVILDAELPSSSYVPWSSGQGLALTTADGNIAPYLAVARLCDVQDHWSSPAEELCPVWFTVRYFNSVDFRHLLSPLTVAGREMKRIGVLEHSEFDVLHDGCRFASVAAVYEGNHA